MRHNPEKCQILTGQKDAKEAEYECQRKELGNKIAEITHLSQELRKKEFKIKDCEQRITRQSTEITRSQNTIRTQKMALDSHEVLVEKLGKEHELKLAKKHQNYEKWKPLIIAGGHLRNRNMEKSKDWPEQDTRLKELGNTASHTVRPLHEKLSRSTLFTDNTK